MNNTQQAGEMNKETLVRIFKKVSLIRFADDTDYEYYTEKSIHFVQAYFMGTVIDCMYYDGNIFWMMNNDKSYEPLNPQSLALEAWHNTPAPDAVETKGRMDAEEFWHTNIAPNNADKGFLIPSWALNFAEKYAAYLAGHAEGQKATVEAKSAGVWVKASERLPVLTTGVGNYFFCHDLRDGSNRLLRYSGGNRGLLLNEPWNYEWLDETTT